MQRFKISIFEKELMRKFPVFETLSADKSKGVIEKLSCLYRLNISDFRKVQEEGQHVANIDATAKDFSPSTLFSSYQQPDNLIVIWSTECTVDIFSYQDFCECFEYIWYPSADDILITSESINRMFMIRHDGMIYTKSVSQETVADFK